MRLEELIPSRVVWYVDPKGYEAEPVTVVKAVPAALDSGIDRAWVDRGGLPEFVAADLLFPDRRAACDRLAKLIDRDDAAAVDWRGRLAEARQRLAALPARGRAEAETVELGGEA